MRTRFGGCGVCRAARLGLACRTMFLLLLFTIGSSCQSLFATHDNHARPSKSCRTPRNHGRRSRKVFHLDAHIYSLQFSADEAFLAALVSLVPMQARPSSSDNIRKPCVHSQQFSIVAEHRRTLSKTLMPTRIQYMSDARTSGRVSARPLRE